MEVKTTVPTTLVPLTEPPFKRRPGLLPERSAQLVVTPHPLTTQGQTSVAVLMQDGETLLAVLQRHGVTDTWIVEVGGLQVPALMWGRTRVHHAQVIECRPIVQGDVVKIIAFAALAWFTMGGGTAWLASATGLAAGSMGLAIAGALVFAAGAMVINKLLPPPKRGSMDLAVNTTEPTYSLSGGRNQMRIWQPMSLVLGQPYVVPDLAGQPYTYFAGEDQYLVQQFHAGINCHAVSDVRIGQTGIEDYQNVSLRGYGLPGSSLQTGLPANSVDTIAGGLLDAPTGTGPWVQRTTSPNTLQIGIDIEGNIFGVNTSNGAYVSREVLLEVQYAVAGSGNWVGVATGATYRESYQVEREGWITGGSGDGYSTYWSTYMATEWRDVPYAAGTAKLTNASTKPLRTAFNIPVPAGQYDVRLRKITANETSTSAQNAVQWTQLKSYQQDLSSYPGQSIVAMTAKASGQLTGAVDELNWIATAKPMPYWNGSAWTTATNRTNGLSNPGALILMLARGIYDENGKLIAGLGWPDSRIDVEGLKRFMVWCAAKGLTFDAIIQDAMSHEDLMGAIAYAGLATLSWSEGRLGVQWLDDAQPVEGVINMGNIKARSFSVSYDTNDRADEIEYGYFDRARGNAWNSLRVTAPGVSNPRTTARLSNMGITSEAHAALLARHAMAQNIYMAKSITFEQDLEFLTYRRGTVLALSHDMTQWGYSGRIQSVTESGGIVTLTLDDAIPATGPDGASSRYIGLRLVGETQYRVFTIAAFTGNTRTVTLASAWPAGVALPGANGQPLDELWIYDFKVTPGQKVVVAKVEPTDNMAGARVTVVPLPDEFWPYVLTGAYTPPPNISLLDRSAVVSNPGVAEMLKRQGNTYATDLTVGWSANAAVAKVYVYGAANGAPLQLLGSTEGRQLTWIGGLAETWDVEIRPFNALGQPGAVVRIRHDVAGLSVPPSNVAGLQLVVESGGVRASWDACTDVDYGETILRVGASFSAGSEVARKQGDNHLLAHLSTGTYTVWAVHADTTGNLSTTPASTTLTIAPPGAPASLQLSFGTSSIDASWQAPAVASNQQPLDRVELSWGAGFTSIIDGRKATTTTFGWLPAGTHTLYARYVDVAGNLGAASQATLQVLAPAQPNMTAVDVQVNLVTLRWQDARTSQPIRKYAIYYGEAGTPLASSLLYGSAGADSRSDILQYRSSGAKVAYLVAEDVAGNMGPARQIDLDIQMPNNFVLSTEYYEDWQIGELTNGSIVGGLTGQIILPAVNGRTWGQRLSNNGWTTAQQKIDAGYPVVMQPVPSSGKHVERHDCGSVIANSVVRVTPTVASSVAGAVVTIRIRASVGASTTDWQAWATGNAAAFNNFQHIEVEYGVTSDGKGFVVLDDLYVRVEVTEVTESATLVLNSADSAGTPYVCAKPFLDVRTVQVTPVGSTNIARPPYYVVDDSVQPAVVRIFAHDASNNRTGGTVSLFITGV